MMIRKVLFGCAVFHTLMFVFNLVISNGNIGSLVAAIIAAISASYCWAESFVPEIEGKGPIVERVMLEEKMHEEELESVIRDTRALFNANAQIESSIKGHNAGIEKLRAQLASISGIIYKPLDSTLRCKLVREVLEGPPAKEKSEQP
jgi:hypothetical protein